MGAFQGEWRIDFAISPITCFFCSIVFAMIFIYYKTLKHQTSLSLVRWLGRYSTWLLKK
jgi:hypothetical protein